MSDNQPPPLDPPPKLDPAYYTSSHQAEPTPSVSNSNAGNTIPIEELEIPKDVKSIAMLAHLLSIFSGVLAPLLIWLLKKQEHPFINEQAKEALNFQITMGFAFIGSLILAGAGLGILPILGVFFVNIILCITAGLKSKDGVSYHYPFAARLID